MIMASASQSCHAVCSQMLHCPETISNDHCTNTRWIYVGHKKMSSIMDQLASHLSFLTFPHSLSSYFLTCRRCFSGLWESHAWTWWWGTCVIVNMQPRAYPNIIFVSQSGLGGLLSWVFNEHNWLVEEDWVHAVKWVIYTLFLNSYLV